MEDSRLVYRKALETARLELVEVTADQERLEKKKIRLRKTIETLSALFEEDGRGADLNEETIDLFENQALPDEIRNILKVKYPAWATPHFVMGELKSMGRDLSKYPNPQSAIQTILKRMADSPSDPTEETTQDGKKTYRCATLSHQLSEAYGINPFGAEVQAVLEKQRSEAKSAMASLAEAALKQEQEFIKSHALLKESMNIDAVTLSRTKKK